MGKSTLINKLLGNTVMETQEIGRGDKGRHTTTGREMFPCPLGGVVIDTPGMREMGAESADLSKTFAEIEELAGTVASGTVPTPVNPAAPFWRQ